MQITAWGAWPGLATLAGKEGLMSMETGLDADGPLGAELVEEPVEGGGVLARRPPDDLAAAVVAHQRQVLVSLAPRNLIDADHEEVVEAGGIEPAVHDALDDAPDGIPVDAHQPADGGLFHGGGGGAHQGPAVRREGGSRHGEGGGFGPHPPV